MQILTQYQQIHADSCIPTQLSGPALCQCGVTVTWNSHFRASATTVASLLEHWKWVSTQITCLQVYAFGY